VRGAPLLGTLLWAACLVACTLLPHTSSAQFCKNNTRIHPVKFPLQYWPIHHRIKRTDKDLFELLSACHTAESDHNEEVCLHNRFLFADFVLYYKLSHRYKAKAANLDSFELALASVRDSLYHSWMQSIPGSRQTGYFEWEDHDLRDEAFQDFLSRGSQNFRTLETLSSVANRKPSQKNEARTFVYETLHGRTPFSSIFPFEALELIQDSNNLETLRCCIAKLKTPNCSTHLFNLVADCAGSEEQAMKLLGVLMTQRMYLLRDWRAWLEQNMEPETLENALQALMLSSELHFRMESYGRLEGGAKLFPQELAMTKGSTKAYHFWSTALLGYLLAEQGYDERTVIKEATRPAKRYKRFIQLPGFAFNLALGKQPFSGTTADYRKVIREQRAGAKWGFERRKIKD